MGLTRLAAVVTVLGALQAAPAAADPWAPGASVEPWPLIARLQGASPGPDIAAGLGHHEVLVRAAAAWAAGRTRAKEHVPGIGALVSDPDPRVRDAALWALLTIGDRSVLPHLARTVATRRKVEGPFWRAGLVLPEGGLEYRREWLAQVDLGVLERRPSDPPTRSGVTDLVWTVARAEIDAGDPLEIAAEVTRRTPERGVTLEGLNLQTHLVRIDEPVEGYEAQQRLRIPVRLRRSDEGAAAGASGGRFTLGLRLSSHELPPGIYLLEPVESAPALLVRIRRPARREASVQALAAAARTPDEIEAVSAQRVASQVDRWRAELATLLQDPKAPLPTAHLRALGRLGDAGAADLFVAAILAARPGTTDLHASHPLLRAFGAAAVPALERAVLRWRDAIRARVAGRSFGLSVVRAAELHTPAIDAVRLEVLRELAASAPEDPPRMQGYLHNPGLPESTPRGALLAAMVAVRATHPEDAGSALATLADRPRLFLAALRAVGGPPDYGGGPTSDVGGFEEMLQTAWRRLPPSASADARSALAAEAERYSIELPGGARAAPESALEAATELSRVTPPAGSYWPTPYRSASRTLRRVLASGLGERDAAVAVAVSRLALGLGEYAEAVRFAARALDLAPAPPERLPALHAQAAAQRALGNASAERAALQELLPHLKGHSGEADVRTRLVALDALPPELRLRTRSHRSVPWAPESMSEGGVAVVHHHLAEIRDPVHGGVTPVGVIPWDSRTIARLGEDAVVSLGTDGTVGAVRAGVPGVLWRARVEAGPGTYDAPPTAVVAGRGTVLVRDAGRTVHAFDAMTGRRRWSAPSHESVPLAVDETVVLGRVTPESPHRTHELQAVDLRTGRPRWTAVLGGPVQAWTIGDGRIAWLDGDGTLHELDARTGRELTNLVLRQDKGAQPGTALALLAGTRRIVVALADRLVLVERGRVVWERSHAPEPSRSWTPQRVVDGGDVVWRVLTGNGPLEVEAWRPSGDRIFVHQLLPWASGGSVGATADGTLVVAGNDATFLLDVVTP